MAGGPWLIGRAEQVAVAVMVITAYSSGFELFITARARPGAAGRDAAAGPRLGAARRSFRFGLQLADGRKVLADPDADRPGPASGPEGPILLPYAFGGGPRMQFSRWWAWPLPPAGPLDLVCEWQPLGIPETRASLDGQLILDAAQRSIRLWPEDAG